MKKLLLCVLCIFPYVYVNAQGCVAKIGSGRGHTVVIKNDHTLWSWGSDGNNQLGNGALTFTHVPSRISDDTDWSKIAVGDYHCVALKSNGTLWAFGQNTLGQLGDGTNTDILAPTQIGTANDWVQIATGRQHSVALKSNGTLWNWGYGGNYALGDGTTADRLVPTQLGTDNDWVKVIAGYYHTVAIKSNGTLWYWGWSVTQESVGHTTYTDNILVPTQIGTATDWLNPRDMSAGNLHTMIIKNDGTLWGWGMNDFGQIGDGSGISRVIPVQIGTDTNWSKISSGLGHDVAVKTDGTLWTFGLNNSGQIGNNTRGTDSTTLEQASPLAPIQITTDSDWSTTAVGSHSSFAIKNNGDVYAWGYNYVSMLGFNPPVAQSYYLVPTYVDLCALLSADSFENNVVNIKAYPNPAHNILNLEANTATINKVELYDVLGRLVLTNQYNSGNVQIDISNLNTGDYIVKLFTAEGIQNLKVIKN